MQIIKLEINGFGKINHFLIQLQNGMNIVYGCNESGKTTVQSFIKAMLFGLKGKYVNDTKILELKKYKPWTGSSFSGSMEYRMDNGDCYRIERDFESNEVRVLDAFFKDVTNSFEVTKQNGVLFAQKHLGVNGICFDQTVFIRQVGSRIDRDGRRELLNRIVNISQTGLEEISYKRAEAALRDALKNHVGTNKTSTRPLDKIMSRLQELDLEKKRLCEIRNAYLEIEVKLGEAIRLQEQYETLRAVTQMEKELIKIVGAIEVCKKKRKQLEQIVENVRDLEDEIGDNRLKWNGYQFQKEHTHLGGGISEDEVDDISRKYYKFVDLKSENERLQHKISNVKGEMEALASDFPKYKAFGTPEHEVEIKVRILKNDLEFLREQYNKLDISSLDREFLWSRKKNKRLIFALGALWLLFLLLISSGLIYAGYFLYVSTLVLPLIGWIAFCKVKAGRELVGLARQKDEMKVSLKKMDEEMRQKGELIKNLMEQIGADNMEDFLRIKASYDGKSKRFMALNNELNLLESLLISNSQQGAALKNQVFERLLEAGIIDICEEVEEQHIKKLKETIKKIRDAEVEENFTSARIKDLMERLQDFLTRASALCSKEIAQSSEIMLQVSNLEREEKELTGILEAAFRPYRRMCTDYSIEPIELAEIQDEKLEKSIHEKWDSVQNTLNELRLKRTEYETLLKSAALEQDELQRLEEEFQTLTAEKRRLKELQSSITLALEVLTQSSQELQENYIPALNGKISNIIAMVTKGKYRDLRADHELLLKMISPETGNVLPEYALSDGAVEQIYLALRIGALELISMNGESLPLIMDEVFAHYDDVRTAETIKLLNDLFNKKQVILFTCKEREVELAHEVCKGKLNLIEL
ncbi:MAG: AAA family ATPase [Clostridia bacterium]|nr:AAA family ATPase [Clostridia bacterium]